MNGEDKAQNFSICLEPKLKEAMERVAGDLGINRSKFISMAVAEFISDKSKMRGQIKKDAERQLKILDGMETPEKEAIVKKKKKKKKKKEAA
jgi:metal-responsive CopG/Arc/MetJ family transcriptional regulator